MRRFVVTLLLTPILMTIPALAHMGPSTAPAVPEPAKPAIRVQPVGEGAWCLYGKGGNLGVVATPEAVLLVDDQFDDIAPAIHDEIKKLSPARLRYVVNTHYHFDHTGGNAYFGKIAALVGHENVRSRLYTQPAWALANLPSRLVEVDGLLGGKKIDPAYAAVLNGRKGLYQAFLGSAKGFKPEEVVAPAITYGEGLVLYLGDEEVRILHVAPGHTDGDSIVWFPKRKVVHMGDLFVSGTYPFIDVDGGGGSEGWLKNLDSVLAKIPDDTRVIPGHGEVAGVVELKRFRAYISDLRVAVAAAIKDGRSLEEAVRDIKLDRYADFKPSFMSLGMNVDQVWREMGGKPDAAAAR